MSHISPVDPRRRASLFPARVRAAVSLAGVLALAALPASAQSPPASRSASVAPMSREEFLRQFDLNSDGSIDASEGELARSRMRQDRAEQDRRRSIDPLTGKPRGDAGKGSSGGGSILGLDEGVDGDAAGGESAADIAARIDEALERSGSRRRRTATGGSATKQSSKAGGAPRAGLFGTGRPRGGAVNAPDAGQESDRPATGGVRAGAPAARPGYGAPAAGNAPAKGKDRPLNAGRPLGTPPPGAPLPGGAGNAPGQASPRIGRQGTPPPASAPRIPLFPDRQND